MQVLVISLEESVKQNDDVVELTTSSATGFTENANKDIRQCLEYHVGVKEENRMYVLSWYLCGDGACG